MAICEAVVREIRKTPLGNTISRDHLIWFLGRFSESSIDKHRRHLEDCGYVITVGRGIYKVVMHPRSTMTASSLEAEAKRMKWKIPGKQYHNKRVSLQLRSMFKPGGWTNFYKTNE